MLFGRLMGAMVVVAMAMAGCASSVGDQNEGGSCAKESDCGGNLICQPITGRSGDFCCPTPPESSSHANCHPG